MKPNLCDRVPGIAILEETLPEVLVEYRESIRKWCFENDAVLETFTEVVLITFFRSLLRACKRATFAFKQSV